MQTKHCVFRLQLKSEEFGIGSVFITRMNVRDLMQQSENEALNVSDVDV